MRCEGGTLLHYNPVEYPVMPSRARAFARLTSYTY